MGSPDGGWYDETPPRVVGASPSDKAANINQRKIRILFSEYIKIDNPSENVMVSPPQLEQPEIKAAGKSIIVELKDTLKPNTTYTIDFSDAITDNNEGNPLGNYTYSFSTGTEIDTLEVSGYVLSAENLEPVKGISVGLYSADDADSVFTTTPLRRIARTDGSGHFVVKGVAPGRYQAVALKDADGSYTFNNRSEMIAFDHLSFEPSFKPDTRYDTIWSDTIHIERIVPVSYTHFLPDDVVLRAFTEPKTDCMFIKSERQEANRFTLYFSWPESEVRCARYEVREMSELTDSLCENEGNLVPRTSHLAPRDYLPEIRGLNFDERDAFVLDCHRDTLTYWLRDTLHINQDTLRIEMKYLMTDSVGGLVMQTDTLDLLSKTPYAKRLKQQQKKYDEWKKQQDKLKKRGEAYDSIMPLEPLALKFDAPSNLDPDKNISIESPTPLQPIDTTKIHLYTKVDTLWYTVKYKLKAQSKLNYTLMAEWRPGQEYSLEVDSAAFTDIYGLSALPIKKGFGVKSVDEYSTMLVTLTGMSGRPVMAQLLSNGDAVLKEVFTRTGQAEFFYITPGTYYLRMFVDSNENGMWDTGDYSSGLQPEPVYYYHEAIDCKAKWDVTRTWDPLSRKLFEQKPSKLVKQKADKQKTVKNKNAERAKQLGINAMQASQVKSKH